MDTPEEIDTTKSCDLCIVEPSSARIKLAGAEGSRYHRLICTRCRRLGWITRAASVLFLSILLALVGLLIYQQVVVLPRLVVLTMLLLGGYCNELRTLHYNARDYFDIRTVYMAGASFAAGDLFNHVLAGLGVFAALLAFKFSIAQMRKRLRYIAPHY